MSLKKLIACSGVVVAGLTLAGCECCGNKNSAGSVKNTPMTQNTTTASGTSVASTSQTAPGTARPAGVTSSSTTPGGVTSSGVTPGSSTAMSSGTSTTPAPWNSQPNRLVGQTSATTTTAGTGAQPPVAWSNTPASGTSPATSPAYPGSSSSASNPWSGNSSTSSGSSNSLLSPAASTRSLSSSPATGSSGVTGGSGPVPATSPMGSSPMGGSSMNSTPMGGSSMSSSPMGGSTSTGSAAAAVTPSVDRSTQPTVYTASPDTATTRTTAMPSADPIASGSSIHSVPSSGMGTTTPSTSIQPPPMPTGAPAAAMDDSKPMGSASEARFGNAAGANDVVISSSSSGPAIESAPVSNSPVVNPGKGE